MLMSIGIEQGSYATKKQLCGQFAHMGQLIPPGNLPQPVINLDGVEFVSAACCDYSIYSSFKVNKRNVRLFR